MLDRPDPIFRSFFLGGFECSTHNPWHRRRLDLLAATQHDTFAAEDYARLRSCGILSARDGIRWHLIEKEPYRYDFSSVLPMLRAARATGMEIIWDLCHYGWPDDLDIFSAEFVSRYAAMSRAFAQLHAAELDTIPLYTPVNEISFFSWAGGTVAYINPFCTGRDIELKEQLVRAAIAGIEAVREVDPRARIVHPDPAIHVSSDPDRPQDEGEAAAYTRSQFDAWDMLCGRRSPHLGGKMEYLDILGVNYYPHNQWVYNELPFNPAYALKRTDPLYRPFRHILADIYSRYERPIFVAETGSDGDDRPDWLRYICGEVSAAIESGVPVEGICLYPIVNFPWWDDDAHLHNGLWDYADNTGGREIYAPLANELRHQQTLLSEINLP